MTTGSKNMAYNKKKVQSAAGLWLFDLSQWVSSTVYLNLSQTRDDLKKMNQF